MTEHRPQPCGESESWGAELAIGLLSGPDRAAALSHMASCSTCREEVDGLARVADRLLVLAPDAEPPSGFESRVLAAVGTAATGAAVGGEVRPAGLRGRRGRLAGLATAIVVVAAVGGGVAATALRTPAPAPREESVLRTGLAVSASGRTSCRVVVTGTRPASVLVSMDGYPGADKAFAVEMETAGGVVVPLGPMAVAGGHGLLVRSLDLDAGTLRLMRMLDDDGRVVYEATLTEPS